MVLTIADAVTNTSGNFLDGEWTNPDAVTDTGTDLYPSGNGVAGIDFVFRFTILPGDSDRDIDELNNVRNHFGLTPALWTDSDTSGNNVVNNGDLNNVYINFGKNFTVWPTGGEQASSGSGGPLAASSKGRPKNNFQEDTADR